MCRELKAIASSNVVPVPRHSQDELLREFAEIYKWSFEKSIYSALRVQGGMDKFDYQNQVMIFDLRKRKNNGGNPGLAFTITDAAFRSKDDIKPNAASVLQGLQSKLLSMQLALRDKKDFVGLMAVLYYVTKDLFILDFNQIYHHSPQFEAGVSELRQDMWLWELQINVSNGFIFRMLGEESGYAARLGRMKADGSKWTWQPMSDEEISVMGLQTMSARGLPGEGFAMLF